VACELEAPLMSCPAKGLLEVSISFTVKPYCKNPIMCYRTMVRNLRMIEHNDEIIPKMLRSM
jgi:hypothetical protein